jgi:hypothetical protein
MFPKLMYVTKSSKFMLHKSDFGLVEVILWGLMMKPAQ